MKIKKDPSLELYFFTTEIPESVIYYAFTTLNKKTTHCDKVCQVGIFGNEYLCVVYNIHQPLVRRNFTVGQNTKKFHSWSKY